MSLKVCKCIPLKINLCADIFSNDRLACLRDKCHATTGAFFVVGIAVRCVASAHDVRCPFPLVLLVFCVVQFVSFMLY